MAEERIGLLGTKKVGPLGVCLAANLVKGRTTRSGLVGVSISPAPLSLDHPLLESSGSRLVSMFSGAFGSRHNDRKPPARNRASHFERAFELKRRCYPFELTGEGRTRRLLGPMHDDRRRFWGRGLWWCRQLPHPFRYRLFQSCLHHVYPGWSLRCLRPTRGFS